MGLDIKTNMRDSRCEVEAVWRAYLGALLGGELIPNELTAGRTAELLDMSAGVDYFYVRRASRGLVPIASRTQWQADGRSHRTHTLRYARPDGRPTEFGKLEEALRCPGAVVPHVILHMYMAPPRGSGKLLRLGLARTRDLVTVMRENLFQFGDSWAALRINPEDGVQFGAVSWAQLVSLGLPLVELVPTDSMFGESLTEFNGGVRELFS